MSEQEQQDPSTTPEAGDDGVVRRGRKGKKIVAGYEWRIPEMNGDFAVAMIVMLVGAVAVVIIGRFDDAKPEKPSAAPEGQE